MPQQMKDSGVDWIDKIPTEWKIERLKGLFSFGKGLPITKDNLIDNGVPVISYGQIHSKLTSGVEIQDHLLRFVGPEYRDSNPQSLVKKGDFIFADTSEDLEGCGNCVYVDRDMTLFAGYHTIIFNSKSDEDNKYLAYLFKTDAWRSQVRSKGSGVKLFSVSRKVLGDATVLVPSTCEQKRIVEYLDKQCACIDTVLMQVRHSIEDYKIMKKAVVTRAVTKGVRGERAMKDSEVEWLGIIPAEWNVYRIANLYDERSESGLEELPILTVSINTGVSDHEIADEDKDRVFVRSEDRTKYKRVYPGDLAYNMMRAWQGAFGAVRVDGMVSPAYVVAKPKINVELDSRYMEALLRTSEATEEMHRYSRGIVDFRLRLYWPEFKNIRICLPSIEEQIEIADYIDEKVAAIDDLIAKKEAFAAELENYKKSMIYEYVTGKKEVPQS